MLGQPVLKDRRGMQRLRKGYSSTGTNRVTSNDNDAQASANTVVWSE